MLTHCSLSPNPPLSKKCSTDLIFSMHPCFSSYATVPLFQHKIIQPLSITSFTLKWDKVWVFSSKLLLLRYSVFLCLEIHTFKTPSCTLSITCLICCSITFSALSKCNLVPLIPTQNAAAKVIVLLCHLDHVNAVPAILQQAD